MTASVNAVAGTKIYIGDSNTVPSPDTYVEIGDVSNLGDLSQTFNEVKIESIGSGDTYSLKGTREYPNLALVLNRNDSDQGQVALKAASAVARGTLFNFKIVETDGGIIVWQGEVFGYGPSYGTVNTVRTVKTSISIRPASVTITLG
jgi:hypothetical protein